MNGKSIMEIIEQISAAEKRTRGCLKTEMNDARIVLTPEDYELLVAEFEKARGLLRIVFEVATLRSKRGTNCLAAWKTMVAICILSKVGELDFVTQSCLLPT